MGEVLERIEKILLELILYFIIFCLLLVILYFTKSLSTPVWYKDTMTIAYFIICIVISLFIANKYKGFSKFHIIIMLLMLYIVFCIGVNVYKMMASQYIYVIQDGIATKVESHYRSFKL